MSDPTDPVRTIEETLSFRGHLQGSAPARCYLLVFEGGTTSMCQLPLCGEVVIGRAREAQLRLQDAAASRQHARLACDNGAVTLIDLGSHNGTSVNGERLVAPRGLASGDVITVCEATLVFHRDAGLPQRRPLQSEAQLRQRLEEEVERSLRYQCPLSVACLDMGSSPPDRSPVLGALSGASGGLRLMDVVAWTGGQLLLILPEIWDEDLDEMLRGLLQALAPVAPVARAGLATCPADGCDADALLSGARAAAGAAGPGQIGRATQGAHVLEVGDDRIVVADPAMARVFDLLGRLAQGDVPVLICGETGTGKEIAAAALHHWGGRSAQRLLTLNCAALPESLVEGELFGYEKGAFSGAAAAKPGLLEGAHQGTLFLDEVGELPLGVQAKLLRVLETKRVTRLGDLRERTVDIRIVAATNRDLDAEVSAGRFRQDLLFRLDVGRVVLPPLRDRTREIAHLARLFLERACARAGQGPKTLSPFAMQRLLTHDWPGNLRQLRNVMEFVVATTTDPVIEPWHLQDRLGGSPPAKTARASATPRFRPLDEEIREIERTRIAEALGAAGGVQTRAAELLSMPLRTFTVKLRQYGLLSQANTRRARG